MYKDNLYVKMEKLGAQTFRLCYVLLERAKL